MNKTLRAFVLPFVLFFTLSTATAPARAVLPVIAAGVALMTEGGMAANGLAALTVGTVAGMIYLGNLQTGAGTEAGSYMEIPLAASRDRSLSVPPGYTAPSSPGNYNSAQPIPPATSTPIETYYTNAAPNYPATSLQASCTAYLAAAWPGWAYAGITGTEAGGYWCNGQNPSNGNVSPLAQSGIVRSCSAGYTVSGTSCVLSNAALVMKPADGRCHILMNVSGFVIDPQDPECGALAANTGTTVTPTQITQTKPGSLTNGKVVINADGSRTITYSSSNTTNNTTTITTINMIPAAGGQTALVTGSSTVVVAGTGTAAGTTPTTPPLVFPDDYNREVTQGQIKTGIDALHSDLDSSGYSAPAPAALTPDALALQENKKITDALDGSVTDYDNFKLLDWSTWVPVFPAASCSPFTGSVMGKTVSWDFCPKIAMLNELIGWLLNVFAAWSVVHLLFRRD